MKLKEGKRVVDYIMEQADRYDGINLKIEEIEIPKFMAIYDKYADKMMSMIEIYGSNMDTTLKMQGIINKLSTDVTWMYNELYKMFMPVIVSSYGRGYSQMNELISIGLEVADKVSKLPISEMKLTPDGYSIDFIRNHSFEMVKGISDDMINQMRSQLGTLLVQNGYSKDNVIDSIEDILMINRSRAESIAQTEMSMAYNNGALQRMSEFNELGEGVMKKYWYGFAFSITTCTYCRPRIGTILNIDDVAEHLPAHPRCRCVWLPYIDGWDTPISMDITRKADMLQRTSRPDEIYRKINSRLGIDYANYIPEDIARDYISGNRSKVVNEAILNARSMKIKDVVTDFDIIAKASEEIMSAEFKIQMNFWKKYTAELIVDNDIEMLSKSREAIKGVMVLPWDANQLSSWDKLIKKISSHL